MPYVIRLAGHEASFDGSRWTCDVKGLEIALNAHQSVAPPADGYSRTPVEDLVRETAAYFGGELIGVESTSRPPSEHPRDRRKL